MIRMLLNSHRNVHNAGVEWPHFQSPTFLPHADYLANGPRPFWVGVLIKVIVTVSET